MANSFLETGALHRLAPPPAHRALDMTSLPPPRHFFRASLAAIGLLGSLLLTPAPVEAVLIATGDGSGNTTAPSGAADPGFANVGSIGGLSGVYIRNGWVLTAGHVGMGTITLLGVPYEPVPESLRTFTNDEGDVADLVAFKLRKRPPLPDLQLASTPPATNTLVTVIGNGRSRGAAQLWMGVEGWDWGAGRAIRWGTNRISATGQFSLNTEAFWVTFDDIPATGANPHEADIVNGDSGGAAFSGSGANAELVGILFAHAAFDGQPEDTSLYGNVGVIVDLSEYRSDILAVITQPECSNGLDDDGDGFADEPDDPGCISFTDYVETHPLLICDNGIDDDGDGFNDFPFDTGCYAPWDSDEQNPLHECDNGVDDDFDSMIDYPDDPGCLHPSNAVEAPEPSGLLLLSTGLLALCGLGRTKTAASSRR
ncbi:MAG: trypsin-like serine protease [Myxococcota bacterium]